jgi:hypothetical protein
MSRLFDAPADTDLLNQSLEENATRRDPYPSGEAQGQITAIKFTDGRAGPHAKNPGAPWKRLDATIEITDPNYLETVEMEPKPEKIIMTLGVMLDMRDGQIATGPNVNVRLGRLREACGVNGKPLGSLVGQFANFNIIQKPHPSEEGVILNDINGYSKIE